MAPEQADGKRGAVGPAADIYSLGVILYEVLTGRPPFQEDSVLDTLVQVRTQDPLPPSRLRPALPRDLETICLKCLHKQPAARYATAAELAEDLRRFLAGEPIRARPTPAGERAIKWVRRHPAVAALAGAGATAAVALAVVIVTANVRLKHERDLAESARLEAVANLQKAREAVDRMLTRVSEERLKDIPQVEPVQRALLEDALEFYRGFARDAHGDREILVRGEPGLSTAWANAYRLRPATEAEPCLREALAIQEKLAADFPSIARLSRELVETQRPGSRGSCASWTDQEKRSSRLRKAMSCWKSWPADPTTRVHDVQRAVCANVSGMILDDLKQPRAAEADLSKGDRAARLPG